MIFQGAYGIGDKVSEELFAQEDIENLMQPGGGTAIIDFWNPTCGPCMSMADDYEAVAKEFATENIRFCKVNTHRSPDIARAFRIRSVPTLLSIHDGEIVDVRVGALKAPDLVKKAKWLLSKSRGESFFKRILL